MSESALPFRRRLTYASLAVTMSVVIALLIGEAAFRFLETRENSQKSHVGDGGRWIDDIRWGWKPSVGEFRQVMPEFTATGHINSLFMNDRPYNPEEDRFHTRVLALGDSHTYAIGVSAQETWPKVLERKLNSKIGNPVFRVYNAGMSGYSVHQYLLRLIDQGPVVRPHYVVVGLSYSTDLNDLLPPDHGGWMYGGDRARDYFDFDPTGSLVERHWDPAPRATHTGQTRGTADIVLERLNQLATFRRLRRSQLSLFIGSHVPFYFQSLWPNLEVILEAKVSDRHRYQWQLLEALLRRLKDEAVRQGATLVIVGIPFLPQVYDDMWQTAFGANVNYSRTAAIERVAAYCKLQGIVYVDTLEALRARTRELGRWVHYQRDGHPTAEGHDAIAGAIVDADVIRSAEYRSATE